MCGIFLMTIVGLQLLVPAGPADQPGEVVYRSDFSRGSLDGWDFTDPKAWEVEREGDRDVLALKRASVYEPPVRSPLNIALLPAGELDDFQLDLEVQSTTNDYGHRDVCIVLGHVDPQHFYYIHLAREADPHAHSIFVVDAAPRTSIAKERTKGVDWGDGWHKVRVIRDGAEGSICVYFDDMTTPIMQARDSRFRSGRIGIGSFDDTARFGQIVVRSSRAKK